MGDHIHQTVTVVTVLLLVASVLAVAPVAVSAAEEDEPNDSREDAQSIAAGEEVTGQLSEGDEDFFAFTVERGETINLTGFSTGDDAEFRLQNPDGDEISSGRSREGSTTTGTTATTSGTYYLRILVPTGAEAPIDYNFTVDTYETDDFEPNEDRANATSITVGEEVDGELSIGDEDFFAFTVERGETINLTGFSTGDDAEFRLQNPDGDEISSGRSREGSTTTGTTATTSGTYYLRILVPTGAEAPIDYNFTVDTYETDDFEPNEDRANASRLYENPFPSDTATLSIGDEDFFAFTAEMGETINLTGFSTGDDAGFRLQNPNGDDIATGRSREGSTTIGTTATTSGTHYLRILVPTGAEAPIDYNFTVDVPGRTLGLANDRFERGNPPIGNQDRTNATDITSGIHPDLAIVDDDMDVFEVSLSQGEKLSTTIDFTHSDNDLELVLRDSQGTIVAGQSDSNTDGESLEFTAPSDGDYYLEVSGEADAQAHYSLNVSTIRAVDVTIGPGGDTLEPGNTTSYGISVSNVGAGLSTANLTLSSSNTTVATIQDVSPIGSATVEHKAVAPGSAELNISGLEAEASGTVQIAEVTISAVENGTATLSGNASLSTASGASYPVSSVQPTTIDIQATPPTPTLPGFADPVTDIDGDGLYEDVNGDGEFTIADVQVFFQNRDSDVVQNNAELFNFDNNAPPDVTIGDVQALFQLFQEQG